MSFVFQRRIDAVDGGVGKSQYSLIPSRGNVDGAKFKDQLKQSLSGLRMGPAGDHKDYMISIRKDGDNSDEVFRTALVETATRLC